MGGTRFVGKPLVKKLIDEGHKLTLFTRGKNPVPPNVEHLIGDRHSDEGLRSLHERSFDVIVDTSGRTLEDTKRVLSLTGPPQFRFLYLSSAGVYAHSEQLPLSERDDLDPSSRHSGKADTERWLRMNEIPFTSFRPTYIYGSGNYNPIEKWFFDRIIHSRPVPLPGNGTFLTQLGHVNDLAEAIVKSLKVEKANNQIYNCSNKQGITLLGLVELAAKVCGKDPSDVKIRFFETSNLDNKSRKAFPLRIGHFLTDISKVQRELEWQPKYDLYKGLLESYNNDYILNKNSDLDFTNDEKLLNS